MRLERALHGVKFTDSTFSSPILSAIIYKISQYPRSISKLSRSSIARSSHSRSCDHRFCFTASLFGPISFPAESLPARPFSVFQDRPFRQWTTQQPISRPACCRMHMTCIILLQLSPGKVFFLNSVLTYARRTLDATSPRAPSFICLHPGCGASFPNPETLDVHVRTHFTDSLETPVPPTCPTCTLTFTRASDLQRHALKHLPESRQYECWVQGCPYKGARGFYRKDKLMAHVKARHE